MKDVDVADDAAVARLGQTGISKARHEVPEAVRRAKVARDRGIVARAVGRPRIHFLPIGTIEDRVELEVDRVIERHLLDQRKDQGEHRVMPLSLVTAINRRARPILDRSGRENAVGALIVGQREADLLQVVDALGAAAGFAPAWTAGSNKPINTAMIAMTTSNSMSVKPRDLDSRWIHLQAMVSIKKKKKRQMDAERERAAAYETEFSWRGPVELNFVRNRTYLPCPRGGLRG